MDSYLMTAICNNCHEEWEEEISKGTSTERHTAKCPNCGCSFVHYHRKVCDFEGRKREF